MEKKISYHIINKIIDLQVGIFAEEDEDYPDRRKIVPRERAIQRILDENYPKELHAEILECVQWSNDDCASLLQQKGWTIVTAL